MQTFQKSVWVVIIILISDNFLQIDERFPEYVAYAVMNLCTALSNLPLDDTVYLTQQFIFGDVGNILTREDFFPKIESK